MASKDDKLLTEARDRFKECFEREQHNWSRAKEAIKFRALDQWPDAIKRDRENPNQVGGARPCPVIDKTNQYVRQVVNEERQNMPSIRVRPTTDDAHDETAEIYDGLIRHIQDISDAPTVLATAGEQAVDGGFGYFRLTTDYCDDDSFDQEILLKPIPNRFSVLLGPHHECDGSDAKYGFVFEDMPVDEFKRKYPGKSPKSFDAATNDFPDWYSGETVRVAEYIRIEESPQTICLLEDGSSMEEDEYKKQAKAALALGPEAGIAVPQVVKTRQSKDRSVVWDKITADQVLESGEIVGTYLPVIKVTGNDLVMSDGTHRLSGMLETAMDSQRLHNYATAKFIETVALAPLAPYVAAAGQVEQRPEWQDANRLPFAVLTYDPIDVNGTALPPPQRQMGAGIPEGWQQLLMNTEHGIEASLGMYGASIGGPARERSGTALQGQRQEGDMGNFHYPDNLARSIRQAGRVLIQWIPKVYDTPRIVRIIGEDDQPQMARLNPDQPQAMQENPHMQGAQIGQTYKSYNLQLGKYDVTVEAGPSLMTKREEASKFAMELARADPSLIEKAGDKIFRLFDVYGMDSIADRLKLFLPPQIQQAESQASGGDPKSAAAMVQVQQAMQQVEMHAQQLQQQGQQLQQAQQQIQAEGVKLEGEKAQLNAARDKLLAEQKILKIEYENLATKLELKASKIEGASDNLATHVDAATNAAAPIAQLTQAVLGQNQAIQDSINSLGPTLAQALAQSHQATADVVGQAMQHVAAAVTKPRKTSVQRDQNGDIVGATQE